MKQILLDAKNNLREYENFLWTKIENEFKLKPLIDMTREYYNDPTRLLLMKNIVDIQSRVVSDLIVVVKKDR